MAQVPCCPAWPKVTSLLEVPGNHEGSNYGTRRSWSSGSRGACLLPEAIGWCSPFRGADKCMRRRGNPSRPPGRRAERGWHGVACGGTVFVCCWRSLLRTVSCMWMRPRGATGPSPDRGLRFAGEGWEGPLMELTLKSKSLDWRRSVEVGPWPKPNSTGSTGGTSKLGAGT